MRKRIVYTRHDGGVSICAPAEDCLKWMSCGGYWKTMPRGFVDTQIERNIADGVAPDAARRFVRALAFGGRSEQEALAIIRDRDCTPHGTAIDLWDVDDIPGDRWFRDAWRRSHNGGPISVSLTEAKPLHWKQLRAVAKRMEDDFETSLQVSDIDWAKIRSKVLRARDVDELRTVWLT